MIFPASVLSPRIPYLGALPICSLSGPLLRARLAATKAAGKRKRSSIGWRLSHELGGHGMSPPLLALGYLEPERRSWARTYRVCTPSRNPPMFAVTVPCHTGSGCHAQVTPTHPLLPESTVPHGLPHFVMPFLLSGIPFPPSVLLPLPHLLLFPYSQFPMFFRAYVHATSTLKVSLDSSLPQNPQEALQICLQ